MGGTGATDREGTGGKLTGRSRSSPHGYPLLLRPLIELHGLKKVTAAGLEALKYPPMWVHTYKEVLAIQQQIENDKGE